MKTGPIGYKKILALAPHTDDAELGCGASISRFLEEGAEVYVAVFSTAEESRPKDAPAGRLKEEFYASMKTFKIPQENLFVHDFPVRKLNYHRQEVLEELVQLRRKIQPDLVFVPSQSDLHQDHQVLHAEGLRAFKDMSMLGYELPWNQITFSAQAFVTIERRHLEAKWESMKAYKTQFDLARPYFSFEFMEGLARVRGTQVKSMYAEAFEVLKVRW